MQKPKVKNGENGRQLRVAEKKRIKAKIVLACLILATLSSFLTVPEGNASYTFKGTTLSIKIFMQGYADYKANIFEVLDDLGIDTVRVYGAGFAEFNFDQNPNWATELKAYLDLLGNNGVKVVFHEMGDWRYLNSDPHPHARRTTRNPWPFGIALYDGIASSKAKIDALAGANSIGYNFLTDPRIPFWILLNEPFLDTSTDSGVNVLDWVKQIADYIRSKGAEVTVGHPSIQHGVYTPSLVLPLYRDHIDYVIFHYYYGIGTYSEVYNAVTNEINAYKAYLGSIPVSHLLIGEIGVQRDWGTEQQRGISYNATFQAVYDSGMGGLFPYILYDIYGTTETWGAISKTGVYFPYVTDQYKYFYTGMVEVDTTPPTFSNIAHNTTQVNQTVKFSAKVQDNVALSGYIFSWNDTEVTLNPNADGQYSQFVEVPNSGFIFGDQFESETGSVTQWWTASKSSGASVTLVTTQKHHGSQSVEYYIPSGSGAKYAETYRSTSSCTELFMKGDFRFNEFPTTTGQEFAIMGLSTEAWALSGLVTIKKVSSGNATLGIYYYSGQTWSNTYGSTEIVTGTWYPIEMRVKLSSSVGVETVWLNDVQEINVQNLDNDKSVNMQLFYTSIYTGAVTTPSTNAHTLWVDCVVVATSQIGVENRTARVSDSSDNTALQIKSSTTQQKETENLQDHTTENGTINYVTTYIRAKASTTSQQAVILWRTHFADYESSLLTIGTGTFTTYSEQRQLNPNTGASWTWDEIDALQIGARATTLSSGQNIQFSKFYILVNYASEQAGGWSNNTWVALSGTSAWANATKTLTSEVDKIIGYRWYINDTKDNWAITPVYTFRTTEFEVSIVILLNTPSNEATIRAKNQIFTYTPIFYPSLENSSLWLNLGGTWQAVAWNTSAINNNTMNSISYTFSTSGTYLWNIGVFDGGQPTFAQFNRTIIVILEPSYDSYGNTFYQFYSRWIDGDGLSGYIFSWNASGTWENSTLITWGGSPLEAWAILVKDFIPTPQIHVSYRFYCKDTDNGWTVTTLETFITPFFSTQALTDYNASLYNQGLPYIKNATNIITALNYGSNRLTFSVYGLSETTSTTKVYCGDRGKPTFVKIDGVDSIIDYDSDANILTVEVEHTEVTIDWVYVPPSQMFDLWFPTTKALAFQHERKFLILNVDSGNLNGSSASLQLDEYGSGFLHFHAMEGSQVRFVYNVTQVQVEGDSGRTIHSIRNGETITITGGDEITISWHILLEPWFPLMFAIGMVGIGGIFAGPAYTIYKAKHGEYYVAFRNGMLTTIVGICFFIAWLWAG